MLAPTPSRWIHVRGQIPNLLSFARGLAPLYLPGLFTGMYLIAPPVAAIICFTDWADGHLARRWKCQSWVGAISDIVSDKIVCYTLGGIGIVFWGWTWWWLIPFTPIAIYDAYTLSMRAANGVIAPSNVAKVKTCVLMSSLIVALTPLTLTFVPILTWHVGIVGLWLSAGLVFWSALHYWWPQVVSDMRLPRLVRFVLGN